MHNIPCLDQPTAAENQHKPLPEGTIIRSEKPSEFYTLSKLDWIIISIGGI